MMHYFDENIAKEYGVYEAVIFQNISYWVHYNQSRESNLFDGDYWTYNSIKSFQILFPYLSVKQIRKTLSNLEDRDRLIISGNYNQKKYDRTKWYSLSKLGKDLVHNSNSICPIGQMEFPYRANGIAQQGQPIPNIKPDNKLNNNTHTHEASKKVDIDLIVEEFNKLGAPFRKVQKLTPNRKKKASERLKEMGSTEEFISVIRSLPKYPFLRGEGSRGWVATFDFLIANSENWVKIKEGIYDNDKQQTSRSESYGQRNTHSKVQDEFGEEGAKAILRSTI